ncbi:MAG: GNAT family N-acetyltransferase [Roseitalea sp.]|jgi:RimJ/RimL family protein N-acetyltransferase|uniref:N-acetyltransferase n=1 Tax=Oceaniradius stylonematis TaxID=2184161 RepID=A0A3A8ABU5_9HYPH|nr:GNAT family N-acetyltransferase [Oceaniradius stylonematis]MBO6554087.1 GNAT family N-acetyltransferase [Roseitalea sp.]MBO6952789.1 GNAT family N-acetyltransferase [Rhizobiaceae bacterium]RNC96751.1 MAG: N-acetyltransferase [Oricola sp.]MBO6593136.1 GNAT family N-acetyltransferase [Roseitalea sp.]MBO6600874.1 GNAT family N-acetyltransferase [Roseitalea sp.]
MINTLNEQDYSHREQRQAFSLNTPVLTTERLVLRMPVHDDADELAVIANSREIAEMTARMPHPYTRADAANYIRAVHEGRVEGYVYAVTIADTGRLVGMCAVTNRPPSGDLEVGYWIGRAWWGKGYASEAASAVVDLAFRVTGANVIYAGSRTVNPRSRQVLVKQGFELMGLDEIDTVAAGRVAIERYRLTRENWLAGKARDG